MSDIKEILKAISTADAKRKKAKDAAADAETEYDSAKAELERMLVRRLEYGEAAVVGDTVYCCDSCGHSEGDLRSFKLVNL